MMITTGLMRRRAKVAALTVIAAATLLAGCGDDGDDATPTPTSPATTSTPAPSPTTATAPESGVRIAITVAGDEVTGGGRREVAAGERVTLTVTADVADEVHVHGYDLFGDVAPGSPATIAFDANIPGVFEVELESAGRELAELVVR
jgi:type V secretory pathway adhesin AidA